MEMGPDRWATVERLYHAALTCPVEGRVAFLAAACAGDEPLRLEVESLLAQRASGDDALARGAVVAAARLMSDLDRLSLTGQRIGVYQVLAPIGAGGMGEVYRPRDMKRRPSGLSKMVSWGPIRDLRSIRDGHKALMRPILRLAL